MKRKFQYFKVEYNHPSDMFLGGVAYLKALNKDNAKRQIRRSKEKVEFCLNTLTRINKGSYLLAKKELG